MNVELTQDILKQKTLKPDDTIHAPDPYELVNIGSNNIFSDQPNESMQKLQFEDLLSFPIEPQNEDYFSILSPEILADKPNASLPSSHHVDESSENLPSFETERQNTAFFPETLPENSDESFFDLPAPPTDVTMSDEHFQGSPHPSPPSTPPPLPPPSPPSTPPQCYQNNPHSSSASTPHSLCQSNSSTSAGSPTSEQKKISPAIQAGIQGFNRNNLKKSQHRKIPQKRKEEMSSSELIEHSLKERVQHMNPDNEEFCKNINSETDVDDDD